MKEGLLPPLPSDKMIEVGKGLERNRSTPPQPSYHSNGKEGRNKPTRRGGFSVSFREFRD